MKITVHTRVYPLVQVYMYWKNRFILHIILNSFSSENIYLCCPTTLSIICTPTASRQTSELPYYYFWQERIIKMFINSLNLPQFLYKSLFACTFIQRRTTVQQYQTRYFPYKFIALYYNFVIYGSLFSPTVVIYSRNK
jgi:hypothetical protein